jgi:hypothetical protein
MVYGAGRPEKMTEQIKQYVYQMLEDNINIKAPAMLNKIRKDLVKKGIDEETISDLLPGQSAIGKYAAEKRPEIRERQKHPLPIDTPWTIGSCIEYEISPETIPILLLIKSIDSAFYENGTIMLTIRTARWINLLWKHVFELIDRKPNENETDFEIRRGLWTLRIAWVYAVKERRVKESTGSQFSDTTELDDIFFGDDHLSEDIIVRGMVQPLFFTLDQMKQKEYEIKHQKDGRK